MTTDRTGYRGVDRLIDLAVNRGLNVTIDRERGTFVVVRIDNKGKAGTGLNDATVSLYVSFSRSKRGSWAGGWYTPLLGKAIEYSRHEAGRSLSRAKSQLLRLYVTAEHTTDWDREREVKDREAYERLVAQGEGRQE